MQDKKESTTFEEHFQKLYDYYKPVMDELPTPDIILTDSSTLPNKETLEHTQVIELFNNTVDEFHTRLVDNFANKYNPLILSNFEELCVFLEWCGPELAIMEHTRLKSFYGFDPSSVEGIAPLPNFNKFKEVYKDFLPTHKGSQVFESASQE